MIRKVALLAAMLSMVGNAFAVDASKVAQQFELKDGSTVYVFKDGKMGMEDRLGRSQSMKQGHLMETKDGKKIMMVGNELARVDVIKRDERGPN